MATRRRSYRGLPPEHARRAARELRGVRSSIRMSESALSRGKCDLALNMLLTAHQEVGAWGAERDHAERKRNRYKIPGRDRLARLETRIKECFYKQGRGRR
jgi:hypothetical protein